MSKYGWYKKTFFNFLTRIYYVCNYCRCTNGLNVTMVCSFIFLYLPRHVCNTYQWIRCWDELWIIIPIAEGTAIGAMGSDWYLAAIYSATFSAILSNHTKMNSISCIILLVVSWIISFLSTFPLKEHLNRFKFSQAGKGGAKRRKKSVLF